MSVHDVITGTGTERLSEGSIRREEAISALPSLIDEISARNINELGLPILNQLLQIEPDCDEDGVPLEESEDSLCGISSEVLVRLQAVSNSNNLLPNSLFAFLNDKEQLMYNKYKLLKSSRFAIGALGKALQDRKSSTSERTTSLCTTSSSATTLAVLNNFASSVSSSLGLAMKETLMNRDALFLNKVLVGELVTTQIEVCNVSKDWSQAATVLEQAIGLVDSDSDEDVMKALMRLLVVDERVVLAITESEESARKLKRFTSIIASSRRLDPAVKDAIQFIDQTIADVLG